jgi:hypothetical protein
MLAGSDKPAPPFMTGSMMHAENPYESGQYLESNPTWHAEDGPWKAKHVLELLERNALKPHSVCEVGSGAGEVLNILSQRLPEARLEGFEISSQALAAALPKQRYNLTFRQGAPFGGDRRDLVMALDVFEHVEDYMGFLRQVRELGEYQIYNIPLDLSVRYVLQKSLIMKARQKVRHLHYFFKDTALATLEDTGHTVVDYLYNSMSLSPGGSLGRRMRSRIRRALFGMYPDFTVRLMGGFSLTVLCR